MKLKAYCDFGLGFALGSVALLLVGTPSRCLVSSTVLMPSQTITASSIMHQNVGLLLRKRGESRLPDRRLLRRKHLMTGGVHDVKTHRAGAVAVKHEGLL